MSLPIDRSTLALAQGNQVPYQVAASAKNINFLKVVADTIDELNAKVDAHAASTLLPHTDGSVSTAKIADAAVTTIKIAPLAVTTAKIANGAVGAAQLDPTLLTDYGDIAVQAEFDRRGINVLKFGARGDGITDDTLNIQAAINYASSNQKLLRFPGGTYLISAPLVLPQGSSQWGLEISGNKSETKYQYLPGSSSTIIKATAVMASMITNRGANPATDVAYYNVVKNIVLDGNNLAVRGYINGWQDKFLDSSVVRCTAYCVSFGDLTNMSIVQGVTMALSANGFESVGSDSTVWYLDKCTIRENTGVSALISSSIGGVVSNSIIESNGGIGASLLGTTDVLKRITSLKFSNVHFENNTGYAINSDRAGSVSPANIEFENCWINAGSKAVNLVYGTNIFFNRCNWVGAPTTVGYFICTNATEVVIAANDNVLASANISITGTLSANVIKIMNKTAAPFGTRFNNIVQAAIYKPPLVVGSATMSMTQEQGSGTVITNRGQTAANVTITLPLNVGVGLNFKAIVGTAQAANFWKFITQDGNTAIFLNGSAVGATNVQIAAPTLGAIIEFTSVSLDGKGFSWIATSSAGTWS